MNPSNTILCQSKLQRIYYFDVLRAIACLAVIMIHSSAKFVITDLGSFDFWVGNIFDAFSRIGVPLFVMLSGALMLDSEYNFTYKKHWGHIKKLILFFCFWSLAYALIFQVAVPVIRGESLKIKDIFSEFVAGHFHLWFIYMLIGIYLIVPILRLFVNHTNKKLIEYFLMLAFVFTFFVSAVIKYGKTVSPVFDSIACVFNDFNMNFVGGYTGYFILGWYLHNYELKHKRPVYILGIGGYLFTVFATYVLSAYSGEAIQAYDNLSFNVLFQSVTVFIFVKEKFAKRQYEDGLFSKVVHIISKYGLGIYGIHAFFVAFGNKLLYRMGIESAYIAVPAVFFFTLIASVLCVALLQRSALFKKFVL